MRGWLPLPWRRTRPPRGGLPPELAASPLTAPAPRRRRLHPALLALICIQALLAGAAAWVLTSSTWQVRYVRVQGTNDAVVAQAIQALPLTGCDVFRCDLTRDVRLVRALPAVAHADVHAAYPDALVVVVVLRTPALVWTTNQGAVVIADDGTVLGALESNPAYAALHLPAVEDASATAFGGVPAAGARLDTALVEMAAQLRSGLHDALGDGWALVYLPGIGLAATQAGGRQVLFGTPRDAASMLSDAASAQALGTDPTPEAASRGAQAQLAALHRILAALSGRGQNAERIDLRWGAHPYWRPANG